MSDDRSLVGARAGAGPGQCRRAPRHRSGDGDRHLRSSAGSGRHRRRAAGWRSRRPSPPCSSRATLAIAPVREAVADFLGIGSTSVEVVPEPDADPVGLPTIDEGLIDLSPSAAESRLGHALPDVAATPLGEPDRIASMPEGGVLLAWSDGATTLWIHDAHDAGRRSLPEAHRRRSGRRADRRARRRRAGRSPASTSSRPRTAASRPARSCCGPMPTPSTASNPTWTWRRCSTSPAPSTEPDATCLLQMARPAFEADRTEVSCRSGRRGRRRSRRGWCRRRR